MKLKVFFLLFLFSLKSFSAFGGEERPLPNVSILPLNDQENLFVKAYSAVGPANIHPTKTPIPGLAPMIEMHYSYTFGLVKHSPPHVALLKEFWQKTSRIIENNQITVGRMQSIALQLAFLLSDMQGETKHAADQTLADLTDVGYWTDLYVADRWKDITHYPDESLFYFDRHWFPFNEDSSQKAPIKPSGFDCVAILCSKSGAFSYNRFVKNYLDQRNLVLHLAAFPLLTSGDGPHGGEYSGSAKFLMHDFSHARDFISSNVRHQKEFRQDSKTKDMDYWMTLRGVLKKIADAPHRNKSDDIGIFLLLHQEASSLNGDVDLPYLGEEAGLPFSNRSLFLSLVSSVIHTEEYPVKNLLFPGGIPFYVRDLKVNSTLSFKRYEEKDDRTYRIKASLAVHVQNPETSKFEPREDMAEVAFDLAYVPVEDGLEKKRISNVSILWNPASSFLGQEKEALERQLVNEWPDREMYAGQSLVLFYGARFSDYEKVLRDLYGDGEFSAKMSLCKKVEAVGVGMKRFWTEFYHRNKELFSDEPLQK